MLIAGLTGGAGSGKSTVLDLFRKLGCRILDVDNIAQDLTRRGTSVYKKIRKAFGDEYFYRSGALNRQKLGGLIFANGEARKRLNEIIHPFVIKKMRHAINVSKRKKGIFVIEVPLLFEVHLENMFDKIILAYLPLKYQLKRLMKKKHLSRRKAVQMVRAQIPLPCKKKMSDFVINTRHGRGRVAKQVYNIYQKLKQIQGNNHGR